jgi:seryl-tRNA(Sec) selenium transferase
MKYTLPNKKIINIPDAEIERAMKNLELTQDEAVQMWLEDNDYEVNDEQEALDEKAKKVKIQHGAVADKERKPAKERTTKVSDEKKALFESILHNLDRCITENVAVYKENITVLKENKLIQVQIGDKIFKIDIIEQRPPKKK